MTRLAFICVFVLAACGDGAETSTCESRCEFRDSEGCPGSDNLSDCKSSCAKDTVTAATKGCTALLQAVNAACTTNGACEPGPQCARATQEFRDCAYGPFEHPQYAPSPSL
jgi:hypothetical protein